VRVRAACVLLLLTRSRKFCERGPACSDTVADLKKILGARSGVFRHRRRPQENSGSAVRRVLFHATVVDPAKLSAPILADLLLPRAIAHPTPPTSNCCADTLADLNMRGSVGQTGICFDNALAESFNAALKVERVHRPSTPPRRQRNATLRVTSKSSRIDDESTRRWGYKTHTKSEPNILNSFLAA
jgi:hypothetical protein